MSWITTANRMRLTRSISIRPRTDLAPNDKSSLERKLADRYVMQGKWKEGRAAFQKIFDANKDNFDAAMRLGDLIEKTGTPEEAIQFYRSLLKIPSYQPKDRAFLQVDIHNRTGNLYAGIKRNSDAITEYHEVLKLDPENAVALGALKLLQGG